MATPTAPFPPIVGQVTNAAHQPDLAGNRCPVADEIDATACAVSGELPPELRGSFVRNGPNPAFEPIGRYSALDGDGMLHAVTIDDAGVSYRNRWIRSRGLGAEVAHGAAVYPGLGDVLNFPDRALTGDAGPVKNPANTHIIEHAGRRLALWEGGLPTEVTSGLDTIGEYDFDGRLRGPMTAHPRLDPRTGEMLMFGYSLFEPYLVYHLVEADGTLSHSVEIDLPAPVMIHDMIMTEQHAVFLETPYVFDLENIGKGPMVRWMPERGARIGVLPRRGAAEDLAWFDIEPGHVQHFWSGWVEGDRIEFHGCRYQNPDFGIDNTTELDHRSAKDHYALPARFWVDLAAGTAGWETMDDLEGDFNRINPAYDGVRVRYLYMSAYTQPDRHLGDFDAVVKYDDATGKRTIWSAGPAGHVGESVFVADPDGSAEDDGWLLNIVYYHDRHTSDLVVIDARDLAAGPVAAVHLPRRVPFGFHANWFPAVDR
ncbi:MAG: carotenoid oxygenase family protein [Acidimicrobiia bacterium]|nr:carotenoid oxygenase family protein [Acidimicrobiia bacterium]